MAGNRVGFVIAPRASGGDGAALCEQVHKISVHSAYHAPTAAQWAALRVLEGGAEWWRTRARSTRKRGPRVAEQLGVPAPEGGCFLFVRASETLRARGVTMHALLEEFARDGVLVAPGSGAGADYEDWFRLCFTAVKPEHATDRRRACSRKN